MKMGSEFREVVQVDMHLNKLGYSDREDSPRSPRDRKSIHRSLPFPRPEGYDSADAIRAAVRDIEIEELRTD